MKIAMINIPIKAPWLGKGVWLTVPPQGYGGIQWVVRTFIDGFLELGHEIYLLGAPGSVSNNKQLKVIPAGTKKDIFEWLERNHMDIIHDSSNGIVPLDKLKLNTSYISTHHFTGKATNPVNTVYLSTAQKRQAGAGEAAPVIRIPVNPNRYIFNNKKKDYLLFLGRVSKWKGALEAARLSKIIGLPLIIAGPAWEDEYLRQIQTEFGETVNFVGEVSGEKRLKLLSDARAVLVMSRTVPGPWGDEWCEPGATVVSEAAVSGTPVVSTDNGCLAEIAPKVGFALPEAELQNLAQWRDILELLPSAEAVRETALREWGYIKITKKYQVLFDEIVRGATWC